MDDFSFFLYEDLKDIGDITTQSLFSDEQAQAVIMVKEDCVLGGLAEAEQVFSLRGATLNPIKEDGSFIRKQTEVAHIDGSIQGILSAERLALNFLGRMSGIATQTKKMVDLCTPLNPMIEIAATRKTTPGFRKYEKKAVVLGGGVSHRMGLYDAFLIKDNHLKLISSVEQAILKIRENHPGQPIEVEVERQEDAITAAEMNVDVIMIDNISAGKSEEIVKTIKKIDPSVTVELSGGITEKNICEYASFADRISLGMLTHTIKNIDFSLEIQD